MAARAIRRENSAAFVVENRLRHDGAGGVAGAEKKDVVVRCQLGSAFQVGLRFRDGFKHSQVSKSRPGAPTLYYLVVMATGVQQPGSQHAAFGLVPRMKALRNLPSTCSAMASTSTPASVRNWRASATL